MADLANLDEDALRAKLEEVDSYEERSAIRKLLREKKKAQGGGTSGTRRGTAGYNRFAGATGRSTPDPKQQHYVRVKDDAPPPSFIRKISADKKSNSPTPRTYSSSSTPPPAKPTPSPPQTETPPPREETPPPKPCSPSPPPKEAPPKVDTPPERSPSPDEEAPYSPPPSPEPGNQGDDEAVNEAETNQDTTDEPEDSSVTNTTDETQDEVVEDTDKPEEPPKEVPRTSRRRNEPDGESPFKVQLRPTERPVPAKPRKTEPQNELESFKLRKTTSRADEKRTGTSDSHDFGVRLKSSTTDSIATSKTTPSSQRQRSYTQHSSTPSSRNAGVSGGSPKTLADFQRLANKSSNTTKEESKLIAYVNTALMLNPPLSTADAFYNVCGRPSVLCNLINRSVRGTVDTRALTKSPPPNASKIDKLEALEENMTLVVESARAIGCQINDDTEDKLVAGDRATIRHIVFELVKARLVHTPGMDEADPSTFTVLAVMMDKLGITTDEQDGGDEDVVTKEEEPLSWQDKGVGVRKQFMMRRTLTFGLLQVLFAVEVAVHSSGNVESRERNHFVRRERRFECSKRVLVTECPPSVDGQAVCESAKVLKGSATHSPCVWTPADTKKNTPDVCALDTHDPCYDENFYDPGRGPGD